MNALCYFMDGVSINAYGDDEQIYDSDKDPVRLEARLQCHLLKADHWFSVNGMISNSEGYQTQTNIKQCCLEIPITLLVSMSTALKFL